MESSALFTTVLVLLYYTGFGQYELHGFWTVLLRHFLPSYLTDEPQLSHVSCLCCSTLDLASPLVTFPFGQSTTSAFLIIALSSASLCVFQVLGYNLFAVYEGLGTSSSGQCQGQSIN